MTETHPIGTGERLKRLEDALRLFIDDERFVVTMGGNPIVVDRAIAQAHAALSTLRKDEDE